MIPINVQSYISLTKLLQIMVQTGMINGVKACLKKEWIFKHTASGVLIWCKRGSAFVLCGQQVVKNFLMYVI